MHTSSQLWDYIFRKRTIHCLNVLEIKIRVHFRNTILELQETYEIYIFLHWFLSTQSLDTQHTPNMCVGGGGAKTGKGIVGH